MLDPVDRHEQEKNKKKLKKISAHLLSLDLHRFIISRNFYLFTIEHDIDGVWKKLVEEYVSRFETQQQILYQEPIFSLGIESLPEAWVDDLFNDFLERLYRKENNNSINKFSCLIASFLVAYQRWTTSKQDITSIALDEGLIKKIALDLFDLDFDEKGVYSDFDMSGIDLEGFLSPQEFVIPIDSSARSDPPVEIQESLKKFSADYPDRKNIAFIMMQFGKTSEHESILKNLRITLEANGLTGVRADDKIYHNDNYYNILTYLHGCGFGIAVIEKITQKTFNANIQFEIGYLSGLNKQVCLLKEKSMKKLPSDLIGKLYQEFDINNCTASINSVLTHWLADKGLCIPVIKIDNSPDSYDEMEQYLCQTGFKKLSISNDMDYSEAKDTLYLNIGFLDKPFLDQMMRVGFLMPNHSLSRMGSKFVCECLGDYLRDG